jgi:hypothetical protein
MGHSITSQFKKKKREREIYRSQRLKNVVTHIRHYLVTKSNSLEGASGRRRREPVILEKEKKNNRE